MNMTPTTRLFQSIETRHSIRMQWLKQVGIAAAATLVVLLVMIYAMAPAHARQISKGIITCDNRFGCSDRIIKAAAKKTSPERVSHHRRHQTAKADANGNFADGIVKSLKTGAIARVASRYAAQFQGYVDDLESAGAKIYDMGGIRRGPCAVPRHKHPCGMALDVCQRSRGVVSAKCNLPSARKMAAIAEQHGLVEGGIWCSSDRGHAEVRTERQAEACGSNLYSEVTKYQANRRGAHRHHRQHRIARL